MRSLARQVSFHLVVLLWVFVKASPRLSSHGSDSHKSGRRLRELLCRITTLQTLSVRAHGSDVEDYRGSGGATSLNLMSFVHDEESNALACIPLTKGVRPDKLLSVELPKRIVDDHRELIARGRLIVRISNVRISNERGGRVMLNQHSHVRPEIPAGDARARGLQGAKEPMKTNGTQSVMIVRVSTADASPQMTLEELEDSVFSTDHTSVASQYRACSYSQLQLEKLRSVDLVLSNSRIGSFDDGSELLDEARNQLANYLGVDSIDNVADRIIFCMAQTSSNGRDWIARTAINHYRVVINGNYCHYLHVKMHEMGHSIGLYHAGIGQRQYADLSCNMGGTLPNGTLTTPQKCFNAYHHYQLGWYASHHRTIDPIRESDSLPRQFTLAAFTDYDKVQTSRDDDAVVILNVANQYYLHYNRANSFNRDTEAMADRVVVNEDLGDRTDLLAGLDVGESYTVENYADSGATLIIKVCHHMDGDSSSPEAMVLSVSLNEDAC